MNCKTIFSHIAIIETFYEQALEDGGQINYTFLNFKGCLEQLYLSKSFIGYYQVYLKDTDSSKIVALRENKNEYDLDDIQLNKESQSTFKDDPDSRLCSIKLNEKENLMCKS
jgi:hypothetical protein